jgi:hypothetical protein
MLDAAAYFVNDRDQVTGQSYTDTVACHAAQRTHPPSDLTAFWRIYLVAYQFH